MGSIGLDGSRIAVDHANRGGATKLVLAAELKGQRDLAPDALLLGVLLPRETTPGAGCLGDDLG